MGAMTTPSPAVSATDFADAVLSWYDDHARDLPWRAPDRTPWQVLVSEVMLQQTPVARVLPVYESWMRRWPTPAALGADSPGEAVRMWAKLGYPRRALRLHACARALVERHGGEVPASLDDLLDLPGVGSYTARAVASFAFGQRHAVVDTNVRRVVARAVLAQGEPGLPAEARDLAMVGSLVPSEASTAARFAVAVMELGALVCTARAPRCPDCPLLRSCAWQQAGQPPYTGPAPRPQRFAGTDRQARGCLLDVLRGSDRPVSEAMLDAAWPEPIQRARALSGLIQDGLIDRLRNGQFALPAM